MFAIQPQTISLIVPGADEVPTMTFANDGADTSKCILTLASSDGKRHVVRFHRHGQLIDQQFIDAADEPDPIYPHDYMVDGRDTRADNPYTHTAPMDADTAYRPAAGFTAPVPLDGEGKPVVDDAKERPKAMKAAEEAARKVRDEREKQAGENAEQRRERLAQEREARKPDGDLKTADDTTAADLAWDAPHATPVPPQPVHGNVNTTQSMRDNTNQQAAQNNYRPEPL